MIHFSRSVTHGVPALFSSVRRMTQSQQREEMCTILARSALGHDPSATPSYVIDYRKACQLNATEQFADAKVLYEKALQGAQNQGCSKERISLIAKDINLVDEKVLEQEASTIQYRMFVRKIFREAIIAGVASLSTALYCYRNTLTVSKQGIRVVS